jgi:hypothetical protein
LCHAILPFVAYAILAASADEAHAHARYQVGAYIYDSMFGIAAAVLLLLFVGIHNAWDAATYHVFAIRSKRPHREPDSLKQTSSDESSSAQ